MRTKSSQHIAHHSPFFSIKFRCSLRTRPSPKLAFTALCFILSEFQWFFCSTFRSQNELVLPPASSPRRQAEIRNEKTFVGRRCRPPWGHMFVSFSRSTARSEGRRLSSFSAHSGRMFTRRRPESIQIPKGSSSSGKKRTFLTFGVLKVQRVKTGDGGGEKKPFRTAPLAVSRSRFV